MDSQSHNVTPIPPGPTVTLNRRSLLKGSATMAALTVAGSTMSFLSTKAGAARVPAASNADHAIAEFPGGI